MTAPPTLLANVTAIDAGAHVTAAAFLGRRPVLALGDGTLLFADDATRVAAHPDASILAAVAAPDRIVTGGDDGRVVSTDAGGSPVAIADEPGQWIDAVALRPDGATAWSGGKTGRTRSAKGEIRSLTVASTARGLAFAPKGYRLAAAHYNGASLWFPNTAEAPL